MIVDVLPLVVDALPILVCEPEPYAVDLGLVGGDIVRAARFYHVVQTTRREGGWADNIQYLRLGA